MKSRRGFVLWCGETLGEAAVEELRLEHVFEIATCRIEEAARHEAVDPISAFRNTAGNAARAATKEMLAHLGFSNAQIRIVRRLLGGSDGGWPGLIGLWATQTSPSRIHRKYAHTQVRLFMNASRAGTLQQSA